MFIKSALVSLAIACSTPAIAQQSAHVHGFASINPSNATERKAVADAIELLRDPAKLFVLPASADCELHEVEAERHAEGEHDKHGEHDKDEHAEHGEDEHDNDDHAHEVSDAGKGHSEFHAHYHFDCKNTATETIELRVFETWPRPRGQFGGNIVTSDPVIRLQ
jgi:hypothetical protein